MIAFRILRSICYARLHGTQPGLLLHVIDGHFLGVLGEASNRTSSGHLRLQTEQAYIN